MTALPTARAVAAAGRVFAASCGICWPSVGRFWLKVLFGKLKVGTESVGITGIGAVVVVFAGINV